MTGMQWSIDLISVVWLLYSIYFLLVYERRLKIRDLLCHVNETRHTSTCRHIHNESLTGNYIELRAF